MKPSEGRVPEEPKWKPINIQDPDPLENGNESFLVTHRASECFIKYVQRERRRGYGFVPFIGAGFSAPSGAPLVSELAAYLQRCILLALGKPEENRWHPRTDQWPPFIDRKYNEEKQNELFRQLNDLLVPADRPSEFWKEATVLMQAYGAAAEWRTSLLFLSRLQHSAHSVTPSTLSLAAPQPEIIDSCFRRVLEGRHPALNHRMLGVLAGALRLNLVLTTNFDDLLETAFAEARNSLEVFEVHPGESLPHWSAVSRVRSLVKLHGNRHSLRADYSLDAQPSEEDKEGFLEYLVGEKNPRRAELVEKPLDFQNHLLVMGVSGDDNRTLALIEHACKRLNENFRVFWLCYSDRDVAEIRKFAERYCEGSGGKRLRGPVVLKHTNYGLLLLQLYQTIRKNLPPFGGLFPSVSRLTLPPSPPSQVVTPGISGKCFSAMVLQRLERFQKPKARKSLKLIVATSDENVHGITSACGRVFAEKEKDSVCLWLDMNDISSTDDLFEVLLEAAYFRLGQENWVPTFHETQEADRADEIKRLMLSVDKPWIIFLNARETPGANTEEDEDPNGLDPEKYPNGWIDLLHEQEKGDSKCIEKFLILIEQLCGKMSPRISVVLMCRNSESGSGLLEQIKGEDFPRDCTLRLKKNMREEVLFSESVIVAEAIKWTEGDKRKQRFLHAFVLMQRPRLLATIWSDAVSPEDDRTISAADERNKWLNQLEKCRLVRRKPGGFIWLHSRSRGLIRKVLWKDKCALGEVEDGEVKTILEKWDPISKEPEIHASLAKWYEKVLDASESPAAVFEAVYHLCKAARRYVEATPCKCQEAHRCLDAGSALLKTNSFLVQTRGYARGSCRRLTHIRRLCESIRPSIGADNKVVGAARLLEITCTEVMRAIAREVGEDKKAFIRHRQFALLKSGRDFDESGDVHPIWKVFWERLKQDVANPEDSKNSGAAAAVELVRWWRWCGMLGTASRSYDAAQNSFVRALQCAISPIDNNPSIITDRELFTDPTKLAGLESQLLGVSSQELQVEGVRVIEQCTELLLLRYAVQVRGSRITPQEKVDPGALRYSLLLVQRFIAIGRKLVSEIRRCDHSSDSHPTIDANWCECRLLIHQSICTSRLFQLNAEGTEPGSGDLISVMGLLGDAEASLRISDPRRQRSELGIVELHRAEARLRKAEAVEICKREGEPFLFYLMCRYLEDERPEVSKREQRQRLRKEWGFGNGDPLLRVRSLVADGLRFLDRAEPILRERRRNVWWTTWFFERYLRLIAMSIWASVWEDSTPIPFLGMEAAAYGTASVADELLDNSLRMISVDAYRLATVIDAYASCAKALQVRLILEQNPPELNFRRVEMHSKLDKAIRELSEVEKRRNDSATGAPDKKSGMDSMVIAYIDSVRDQSRLILKDLESPF